MRKKWVIYFLVIFVTGCYRSEIVFDTTPTSDLQIAPLIKLDGKSCYADTELNLIRYSISKDSVSGFSPLVEFKEKSELYFNGLKLQNNKVNQLGDMEAGATNIVVIKNGNKSREFEFVFTTSPIVQVIYDSEIYDEPKTLVRIHISDPEETTDFLSFAGIEHRGTFSRGFDKKSFGFTLWKNMNSTSEYSTSLLNFGRNNDWILNGAIVDPARIRNMVSFEIWKDLKNGKENDDSKHIGIHPRPVELFMNNRFWGLYIFSDNLNQAFLSAGNEAVLYKAYDWADGATRFETYDSKVSRNRFWNGWEQKIPYYKEKINWEPLNKLYEVAVNSSDESFKNDISELIDIDNFIDYYLFLNLTSAIDNTGKNIFLYKENKQAPFTIIPWDLDGSWGLVYDGTRMGYNSVLSNRLFQRLFETNPGNFISKLKNRWFYLRQNSFNEVNLNAVFDSSFYKLISSDIIQMENKIWNQNLNMQEEQEYIQNWTKNRLDYLDGYFESL
ncbi:CotH kinase family protein [Maribellus maritimus]|uniref:CotH kinase family protein n=1 Tax=Maribellus maritimus TaxID=2870838 RepID=UPI001EECC7CE|nr:CotH kinase family protein [Maribellus maritimus]MCG6187455.1 CotH kinase family protein [Maribellus maritimus]